LAEIIAGHQYGDLYARGQDGRLWTCCRDPQEMRRVASLWRELDPPSDASNIPVIRYGEPVYTATMRPHQKEAITLAAGTYKIEASSSLIAFEVIGSDGQPAAVGPDRYDNMFLKVPAKAVYLVVNPNVGGNRVTIRQKL
jgi:hypothetical protein